MNKGRVFIFYQSGDGSHNCWGTAGTITALWGVSSSGRATPLQGVGEGFKSLTLHDEAIYCFSQVSNVEIRLIKPETLRLISGELEVTI